MVIKYCTKTYRKQDGKTYYVNIFNHVQQVKMCIIGDEKIFEIDVNVTDKPGKDSYYGWLEADGNISYVYPHLTLLSVCFPYGYKAEENRGRGKLVRIDIKERKEIS